MQPLPFVVSLVSSRKTKTCEWRLHNPLRLGGFGRLRPTGVAVEICHHCGVHLLDLCQIRAGQKLEFCWRDRHTEPHDPALKQGNTLLGSELFGAIEFPKFPVKRAERQMPSLTSHFQNQTIRESEFWPLAKLLKRNRYYIGVLQCEISVIEEHLDGGSNFCRAKFVH